MSLFASITTACWAVFFLYWIASSFIVKRDAKRSPWKRWWLLRFAIVIIILGWLGWSSIYSSTYLSEFVNKTSTNTLLASIGAALCVLGIALAIWARIHLGRNWSPTPIIKVEHELVTSGPYRLIRHPIYTGVTVALIGSTLVTAAWLIMLLAMVCMFIWRIKVEEKLMMQQFPNQYPEYKNRTWALIPYAW